MLVIDLHFPDAGSLKGKRKELSSIKAQLAGRLGVAVSETGYQDLWQRATLTAALTGGSLRRLARRRRRGRALGAGPLPRGSAASSGWWPPSRICEDERMRSQRERMCGG